MPSTLPQLQALKPAIYWQLRTSLVRVTAGESWLTISAEDQQKPLLRLQGKEQFTYAAAKLRDHLKIASGPGCNFVSLSTGDSFGGVFYDKEQNWFVNHFQGKRYLADTKLLFDMLAWLNGSKDSDAGFIDASVLGDSSAYLEIKSHQNGFFALELSPGDRSDLAIIVNGLVSMHLPTGVVLTFNQAVGGQRIEFSERDHVTYRLKLWHEKRHELTIDLPRSTLARLVGQLTRRS